jgi:hypothetical protein
VARVYERIGFARLATVGVADLPDGEPSTAGPTATGLPG